MKVLNQKIGWEFAIAIFLFVFFSIYWVVFNTFFSQSISNHHQIYTYSSVYGITALWGAICGVVIAKKWGGFKSVIGRALILFSLGLCAQEFGQLVYSYFYIVLRLETADYPSLGDVGFFSTIPFYCLGILYIGKAAGVGLYYKSLKHIVPAIMITFGLLGFGYFLFLQDYTFDWSQPIKTFLDFGYPLGAAIYISLAIGVYILSKGVLGGIMKNKILFLIFALCIQFLADYMFLYQTSRGTWVDSGINDFTYFIAYFVMTLALIKFNSVYEELKRSS